MYRSIHVLRTILFQCRMHFLQLSRSLPNFNELLLVHILKLSSTDFWVIAHCSLTLVNMTWNTALFWDTVSIKTRGQCLKVRPHGLLCIIWYCWIFVQNGKCCTNELINLSQIPVLLYIVSIKTRGQCLKVRPHGLLCIIQYC